MRRAPAARSPCPIPAPALLPPSCPSLVSAPAAPPAPETSSLSPLPLTPPPASFPFASKSPCPAPPRPLRSASPMSLPCCCCFAACTPCSPLTAPSACRPLLPRHCPLLCTALLAFYPCPSAPPLQLPAADTLQLAACRPPPLLEHGRPTSQSPHWGLNPGPSVYRTDALPLSYRGSSATTLPDPRRVISPIAAGKRPLLPPAFARQAHSSKTCANKKSGTLLDLCVSSLRRGHANLLCIVPILTDDPRRESRSSPTPSLPGLPSDPRCRLQPRTGGQRSKQFALCSGAAALPREQCGPPKTFRHRDSNPGRSGESRVS